MFALSHNYPYVYSPWGFPGGLVTKNLSMQETQVRSLGREDPLKKEMESHSSTLAWEISWTVELGRLQSTGLQKESDMTE